MSGTVTLEEIWLETARHGLAIQGTDGSMPPGHNGPHAHRMTPVRTTAHWSRIFLEAFSLTGISRYRAAANRSIDYLVEAPRTKHGSVICRSHPGTTSENGLIGQAWTLEALIEVGGRLEHPIARRTAESIRKSHTYDTDHGLWGLPGSTRPFRTTNQQLWFGLWASRLLPSDRCTAGPFLDWMRRLSSWWYQTPRGLILHRLRETGSERPVRTAVRRGRRWRDEFTRSLGYHSFLSYALASAVAVIGSRVNVDSEPFARDNHRALRYARSASHLRRTRNNVYAWTYNPTGIEVAVAIYQMTGNIDVRSQRLVVEQMRNQLDKHTLLLSRGCDSDTSISRLYEAAPLLGHNIDVNLSEVGHH